MLRYVHECDARVYVVYVRAMIQWVLSVMKKKKIKLNK